MSNATHEILVQVDIHWKCRKCGHRQPMETEDGNEEWKFHCGEPMKMQPTWKLMANDRHST